MKIIKLLYTKFFLSLSLCLISTSMIFFIFSLIGNLNEDYIFNIIIKISIFNSLQIISYVPAFIFLISIILFTIFLRSKNEMIIIRSYVNLKIILIFFLPIVIFFTILELKKNDLGSFFDKTKTNLIRDELQANTKIIIQKDHVSKTFTVLKNINARDMSKTSYWSYDILDKKIQLAQYSNNLVFSNNSLIAKYYTQYKDNLIRDFKTSKKINLNISELFEQDVVVKNLTIKNNFVFDLKQINLILFFIIFFNYIILNFLSKNLVSSKQSIKGPIFACIIILIYSFLIFNNSLSFYKQEFEFLACLIIGLFFIKVYKNE